MKDKERIKQAEIGLLRFFVDCVDIRRAYPADDVMYVVQAGGCNRAEIKEARRRLGIASVNTETGQRWLWASEPQDILNRQQNGGGEDERERD